MKRAACLVAIAGAAVATPAAACSVARDYRIPSNYDLIAKADLVVLGRVASGPRADQLTEDTVEKDNVGLEPIRAIKGTLPTTPLAIPGFVASRRGAPILAHPTPLNRAHPDAFSGACIRYAYSVGTLVVAVFRKDGIGYRRESSPFARSVEDVEGVNGAWVRAADSYAGIAAMANTASRRAALEAEANRLLALKDDSAAPAIAADMLDTLDGLPD